MLTNGRIDRQTNHGMESNLTRQRLIGIDVSRLWMNAYYFYLHPLLTSDPSYKDMMYPLVLTYPKYTSYHTTHQRLLYLI